MMSRKQLVALFACSLIGWTIAQGTLALLPVYAVRLGADPALAGNYLALAFAALTVGTVTAGWLSDRFQRRKALLVVAGLVNVPATWLMGQATTFWQLAILTAIVWLFVGVGFTAISVLAGLFAGEAERGKVFGILAINTSLGALIGGAVSGRIVDNWGYPAMFLTAALCWVLQPMIALLLRDKVVTKSGSKTFSPLSAKPAFGAAFYLLLVANIIAFGGGFVALLGRPLLMDNLGFDSTAISGVVAVGGAVSLPFPLLLGWLSDRIGRHWLIVFCFLAGALGLVALALSLALWHFWASAILLAGVGVSLAIGPALVTDLVPGESLGKALAWYGFGPSMGGIIGFALTGVAIQNFGMTATFIGGALLTLIAMTLVIQVRRTGQQAAA
jgi:SET family sugar efflux transporter-like MFS transporter